MKTKEIVSALSGFCLLVSLPALAQQMVMPPPAAQAIEAHQQQTRTQKQREAVERKRAASLSARQNKNNQPDNPKADTVAEKPKAVGKPPKAATVE